MSYTVFTFKGPNDSDQFEILMAELLNLGFEAFEERDKELDAYWPHENISESLSKEVNKLANKFQYSCAENKLPEENWNAQWEASFQPVQVGNFCGIRADFHPDFENVQYQITINPKMAFGTGHHETTHLVISMMSPLSLTGKKVFDFGCGTGILAILASMMGAQSVLAIDYDENATENTLENIEVNRIPNISVATGELDDFQYPPQDLILANINKPVLLKTIPSLVCIMEHDGILIVSGIMLKDQADIEKLAQQSGLKTMQIQQKGDWLAIKFGRQTTV